MSQTEWILNEMKRGRMITPVDALAGCNCFRLAARIDDLRAKGHKIITTMLEKNGKRYAGYTLLKGKK